MAAGLPVAVEEQTVAARQAAAGVVGKGLAGQQVFRNQQHHKAAEASANRLGELLVVSCQHRRSHDASPKPTRLQSGPVQQREQPWARIAEVMRRVEMKGARTRIENRRMESNANPASPSKDD